MKLRLLISLISMALSCASATSAYGMCAAAFGGETPNEKTPLERLREIRAASDILYKIDSKEEFDEFLVEFGFAGKVSEAMLNNIKDAEDISDHLDEIENIIMAEYVSTLQLYFRQTPNFQQIEIDVKTPLAANRGPHGQRYRVKGFFEDRELPADAVMILTDIEEEISDHEKKFLRGFIDLSFRGLAPQYIGKVRDDNLGVIGIFVSYPSDTINVKDLPAERITPDIYRSLEDIQAAIPASATQLTVGFDGKRVRVLDFSMLPNFPSNSLGMILGITLTRSDEIEKLARELDFIKWRAARESKVDKSLSKIETYIRTLEVLRMKLRHDLLVGAGIVQSLREIEKGPAMGPIRNVNVNETLEWLQIDTQSQRVPAIAYVGIWEAARQMGINEAELTKIGPQDFDDFLIEYVGQDPMHRRIDYLERSVESLDLALYLCDHALDLANAAVEVGGMPLPPEIVERFAEQYRLGGSRVLHIVDRFVLDNAPNHASDEDKLLFISSTHVLNYIVPRTLRVFAELYSDTLLSLDVRYHKYFYDLLIEWAKLQDKIARTPLH